MTAQFAGGEVTTSRLRTLVHDRARTADLVAAVLVSAAIVVYAVNQRAWLDNVCYLGVLVGAAVSALVAAETAPRGERLVPWLVAAGLALTALGDVLWQVVDSLGMSSDVSVADPPWFASYLTLCAAMWAVLARSRPGRPVDPGGVIDAVTIVAVSVLVFWHLSVADIVGDRTVPASVRVVWASYPVADAVLLGLVVRVLLNARARSMVGRGFAVGVALWLAADVAYLRTPSPQVKVLMDSAWMVAPVLMARAVWHWSPQQPAVEPDSVPTGSTSTLVVAVVPLLVPSGLELVGDLRGQPDRPGLLVAGTLVLIVLAFLRTSRLINAERVAREELVLARDAALGASRAKSMFVATMSHEIRTPLTTVLASAEMLEETSLDGEQRDHVRRMRRSGGLLRSIVEDVLDFSRIESGHLRLASTTFDLHALVAHLADTYAPRTARAGLAFDCRVDADVPRSVVGDPERLQQVAGNLLDNALKFTDAGGLRLHVRLAAESDTTRFDGRAQVELVVSDTGIGIEPDRLERVLEAFEQADGSSTRRHGGVGLGLAICQELVALMGGTLTVRSSPGRGSEFVASVTLLTVPDAGPLAERPLGVGGAALVPAGSAGMARAGRPRDLRP